MLALGAACVGFLPQPVASVWVAPGLLPTLTEPCWRPARRRTPLPAAVLPHLRVVTLALAFWSSCSAAALAALGLGDAHPSCEVR